MILKERVKFLQIALGTIAAFFVGISGVSIYLLNKGLDVQKAQATINDYVVNAEKEIDRYADSQLLNYQGDENEGCARIKDFQLCWGKKLSEYSGDRNTRHFDLHFKEPFKVAPVVTESLNLYNSDTKSSTAYPFAVYADNPSPEGSSGYMFAIRGPQETPETANAYVNYVATGRWR